MNIRYLHPKIILFSVFLFLVNCSGSSQDSKLEDTELKSGSETGSVVENRSTISATVIEVEQLATNRFRIALKITKVESVENYENLAKVGEVINVYPNFIRKEGQELDYSSDQNKQMLLAGTLLQNSNITAEVYYRGGRGDRNRWLLLSWQ